MRRNAKKVDRVHARGRVLFIELAALDAASGGHDFHAVSSRVIGNALATVGLGLSFSPDLRLRIANGYLNAEGNRERFCDVWRRAVLNEKRLWSEFRLGIKPVVQAVN